MSAAVVTFNVISGTGREYEHELPARFEVCERCEGHGSHLHEAIGSHAYSVEEFREAYDEEEAAEYFKRGGIYDVTCSRCKGRRVEPVVDEPAAARTPRGRRLLKLYARYVEDAAAREAERASEERWGY